MDRVLAGRERFAVSAVAGFVMFSLYYVLMQSVLRDALLVDSDTLMHITIGNWILQNGSVPTVDHFSYTTAGKTWFATDWISEILFASCFKIGRWWAVSQIAAICVGLLAGGLTAYLTKVVRLSVAVGTTAIIVFLTSPHFLARPVLFSYVLTLAWVIALLEIEDREMWTRLAAYRLVPIMVLWANMHGSFTFGLATFWIFVSQPTFAAVRARDLMRVGRLLGLALAVSMAAVVTPYGILPLLRAVKLMSVPVLSQMIDEWHPPDFNDDPFHLVALVGLFGILLYLRVSLGGPRLATLLLVTVFALEHKRGLGLFSLVAPLIVLKPVIAQVPWLAAGARDPVVRFISTRSVAITVGSIAAVVGAAAASSELLPAPHPRVPEAALKAAIQKGLTGNVLNSYDFGGFLMFNGISPFVDGRVRLHGNELLSLYFSAMNLSNTGGVDELVHRYGFQWALLHPTEPIIYKLRIDGWKEVYRDPQAIVLTH